MQCFRPVEVKDISGAGAGIALITKTDLIVGRLIEKGKRFIITYSALNEFGS